MRPTPFRIPLSSPDRYEKRLPERSNAGPVFDRVFRFVLFGILFRNVWGYVVRMFTCGRPLSCRVRLCGFLSFPACPECLGALSRGAGIPCAGCLFAVPSRRVPLSSGTLPKADCNCGSRAVRIVFDPRNTPGLLRCPLKPPSGLFRESFFGLLLRRKTFGSPRRDIPIKQGCCCRAGPQAVFIVRLLPKNYRELHRSDRVRSGGSARVPVVGTLSVETGPYWCLSALGEGCRSLRRIPGCRCILLEVPG